MNGVNDERKSGMIEHVRWVRKVHRRTGRLFWKLTIDTVSISTYLSRFRERVGWRNGAKITVRAM